MITEAYSYLKESDDAVETVLIGGLLLLLSPFLIPALIISGYTIGVMERVSAGDTDAPTFRNWGTMFIDGIKAFIISFLYVLVPTVLAGVVIGAGALVAGGTDADVIGAFGIFAGMLLATLLGLVVAYLVPAALVNFSRTKAISDAFAFGQLRPILSSGRYATGWVLALVVFLIGSLITSVLVVIPLLGWIAALFVAFYVQVMASFIYARAYAEALEMAPERETTVRDERPAI